MFAVVEALGGWWTGSLALISDAGHMLTDGGALALGALAGWMARRPPSGRHSYGFGRAEIFAAVINASMMLAIGAAIAYEAFIRLGQPREIQGGMAAAIALVSGIVIVLTGWTPIDAIASLFICLLIAISSLRLLREGVHALMEGVPLTLSVEAVGMEMAKHKAITSVHDLHIWTLSGSRVALSAHVVVRDLSRWDRTLHELQALLRERFGIDHVTLQPESLVRPAVKVPVPDPRRRKG